MDQARTIQAETLSRRTPFYRIFRVWSISVEAKYRLAGPAIHYKAEISQGATQVSEPFEASLVVRTTEAMHGNRYKSLFSSENLLGKTCCQLAAD